MQQRRVLIGDDDLGLAVALRAALVQDGFVVDIATTMQDALRLIGERRPEIVLVDPTIPGTRGWNLCRSLIEEHGLPVVVLAGRSTLVDNNLALDLGADDFIGKPCSPREVAARVKSVLRRYEGARESEDLRVGDLAIDVARRQARLNGRDLALRTKEFDLLAALATDPGVVLSRERLLRSIWGYTYLGNSRTVDVYACWPRTKLRDSSVSIEGVWAVGYKLAVRAPTI